MPIQYVLEFLNNCGKWQVVDSGTKSHVESELKNRATLFHDADRYRIRRFK